MNVALLRRIQRQIDKAPERFFMSSFSKETECGTVYCIAGWACALSGKSKSTDLCGDAVKLLGLDCRKDEPMKLFNEPNWPQKYRAEDSNPQLPALAIARINHFIATEGRE